MNTLTRDIWRRLDAGDVSKNKYLMKKPEVVPPVIVPVTDVNLGDVVMDLEPALDGIEQTPDDWIEYWNEIKDGRVMASMADYYVAAKSGDSDLISSLRVDLYRSFIIGGDRIFYDKYSLDATIISYFGSTNVKPIERRVHIPDYDGVFLDSVFSDPLGLKYLQSLFRTSDSVDVMKKTFFDLTGKKSSETRVRTPDRKDRFNDPNRAAFVSCGDDGFRIIGGNLNYDGRSRGVRHK